MNPYMCIFLLIAVAAGDYRPVIGIVAFPSEFEQYDQGNFTQIQPLEKFLQVPKSYVDWIEAAGARVIPIPFDVSQETLFIKLRYLNAVIIPGGFHQIFTTGKVLSPVALHLKNLLQLLYGFHENGLLVPLFIIHNGATMADAVIDSIVPTKNVNMFRYYKAEDLNANIRFTFNHGSQIWSQIAVDTLDKVAAQNSTYYYHNSSLSVEAFLNNDYLRTRYDITAQSLDRLGWWLVAAMEHKEYPIYFTQFLPNAPTHEIDTKLNISRTQYAKDFGAGLAKMFVMEAHKMPPVTEDVSGMLIENYQLVRKASGLHGQIYLIPK